MISYEEALSLVLGATPVPKIRRVELQDAASFVLAEDIFARFPQPPFDNSAMDGYALHIYDLEHESVVLTVTDAVRAGQSAGALQVNPGCAVQVMTGAAIPVGCSAVVMQEDVDRDGDEITIRQMPRFGQNIRREGCEISTGDVIARVGDFLTPPRLSALASNGTFELKVFDRPRLGLLVTGDELAPLQGSVDDGKVYESNSAALCEILRPLVSELTVVNVGDCEEQTIAAVSGLLEKCDVVVSSGGMSVGAFDFVREAFRASNLEFLISKVAIKPGKPFAFAVRKSDGKVAFGLPGNPMSALCTCELFVVPFLRKMVGRLSVSPRSAFLNQAYANQGKRDEFVPGRFLFSEGRCEVDPCPTVGSHAVAGLNTADCLIRVPAERSCALGELVETMPLSWGGCS